MDDLILRYVNMPMTIRIFKEDKEKFKVSTMSMLYDDIFDSMIEALQHDYNELRKEMYTVHHLDIKRVGLLTYTVNKQVVEYTAEQLKRKTEELMNEYMTTTEIKRGKYKLVLEPPPSFSKIKELTEKKL